MSSIDLKAEEVTIILKSLKHCLDTCKEGGTEAKCPECEKVQGVMAKLQASVGS